MPRPTSVTCTYEAASVSNPVPLNWRSNNFSASIRVTNTGDTQSKVQYTFDNVLAGDTAVWIDAPSSTGLEAVGAGGTEIGAIAFPCMAVRLARTAGTSGGGTMLVIEST